jgi:epoxyqueuosine reductase
LWHGGAYILSDDILTAQQRSLNLKFSNYQPPMQLDALNSRDTPALLAEIKIWSLELGFADVGVSNLELSDAEQHLIEWLGKGFHGTMSYMQRHGLKRTRPWQLIPGTVSILSLRMDYLPESQDKAIEVLQQADQAYISRYALGRDYHKLIRQRLNKLARKIQARLGEFEYRVFTDSAPVMEKPIASKAGLGWVGKHSNILNREAGSWFFLGEIYLNFALPESTARQNHCGECTSCIDVCPTQAIVEPYVVDARKCISYLTIENDGDIPVDLRPLMGNRIYGCDDCQLFCPWNRFATTDTHSDFQSRHHLDSSSLADLFSWTEVEFLKRFEGSPIRRIGYQNWLRNIAVALGNASKSVANLVALQSRQEHSDVRVREHIYWAIEQQKL